MSTVLGFVGLGVMGGPMCRHLAEKSGRSVVAYDTQVDAQQKLASNGVHAADSVAEVVARAETVFFSLPSGEHLREICEGEAGLLATAHSGQTVVDLGTSPVALTRDLGDRFAALGVNYADAPVARTRAAAEAGTLAVTVGATTELFLQIEPLVRCFASDVTHCGPVGSGQVVKILNNMIVVSTVVALCEAASMARATGLDTTDLFQAFAKGSADSFALRNHGLKSVAPKEFPQRVFSTEYMLKDMNYALELARDASVEARSAERGQELLSNAASAGWGAEYWPVISRLV